jgi:hypothetical protein
MYGGDCCANGEGGAHADVAGRGIQSGAGGMASEFPEGSSAIERRGSHRRSYGDLAPNMRERWKAINEIAVLINAGNFMRASDLAKKVLPLPKDMTQRDFQELAADFDERVNAFRRVLEVRDPMQSLQAWNTVFQGCVGCHMEQGIKGQKLQE